MGGYGHKPWFEALFGSVRHGLGPLTADALIPERLPPRPLLAVMMVRRACADPA
jgi:hypothetical protein